MTAQPHLLIVDDDQALREALSGAFTRRGYNVSLAGKAQEACELAASTQVDWALVDLNMPGTSGLALIPQLQETHARMRIVVLTGYASIATAVEAIKLGAIHYLTKPVTTEEILNAFQKESGDPHIEVESPPLTLMAAERAHILQAFTRSGRNLSATARELGMHRRSLQRKLEKLKIK